MTHSDKVVYVGSLLGGEKAKDAKGGGGRDVRRSADDVVRDIDAAYARGDQRDPSAIFEAMEPSR